VTQIDLSGDNRLPALLDEREELKLAMASAKGRLAELDDEIKDKLGSADAGALPGWRITHAEHHRNGYTVAPSTYRVLKVERAAKAPLKPVRGSAWSP
jgi:hypothetical protein